MAEKNNLRGFNIIQSIREGSISMKLIALNGDSYIVLINRYCMGLLWKSRRYQFDQLSTAEIFYRKLSQTKTKTKIKGKS